MVKHKVLIIDDNEMTRKLVRLALTTETCEVIEAADGRSGLQALEEHRPDLILQDLLLPDMGGMELVRQLRSHGAGAEIPIIAVSGFQSELSLAERLIAGFTDFLFKPVEPRLLLQVVTAYLPANHPLGDGGPVAPSSCSSTTIQCSSN